MNLSPCQLPTHHLELINVAFLIQNNRHKNNHTNLIRTNVPRHTPAHHITFPPFSTRNATSAANRACAAPAMAQRNSSAPCCPLYSTPTNTTRTPHPPTSGSSALALTTPPWSRLFGVCSPASLRYPTTQLRYANVCTCVCRHACPLRRIDQGYACRHR
jgi:hypothetical protein